MKDNFNLNKLLFLSGGLLLSSLLPPLSSAATLSLGADYFIRGNSREERDTNFSKNQYYDQRLEAYLVTDLSRDVEATVRVQSINIWGLEGSTNPLSTRYPDANGGFWIQNAFARLPNFWDGRIVLTVGRQPIIWGDGAILSDDDLGFNAIRFQLLNPVRWFEFDLDGFTAKIDENEVNQQDDTNLSGVQLAYNRQVFRWEIMGLWEDRDGAQMYEMGSENSAVNATDIKRTIYGVRAKTRVKDAYIKGEYYMQNGKVMRTGSGRGDVDLGGSGYIIGVGAKSGETKFGRFGAKLEYANGSGDDPETEGKDEAFRPTFASRWSGLERKGYGRYFASGFSDVYSSSAPFATVNSVNDGLPSGVSGIQTIQFGVEATPWAKWTFGFDYFTYKAQKVLVGNKELGTEFDYTVEYRYSGLVTLRAFYADFRPKEAFPAASKKNASLSQAELEIKF